MFDRFNSFTMLGVALASGTALLAGTAAALDVEAFASMGALDADARYERFYVRDSLADPPKDFIGADYDWSGVGRSYNESTGLWKKFATMISDTHFLTAAHFGPLPGRTVTFFRHDDPDGESWTGTVAEYVGNIGDLNSSEEPDLRVTRLTEAPPAWVRRYPLISRPEDTNYLWSVDRTLLVAGRSDEASEVNTRVGRNEIYLVGPVGTRYIQYWFNPSSGFGFDEAQTEGGDSGGPSFAVTSAGLTLAGIHAKVNRDHSISANLADLLSLIDEPVAVVADFPRERYPDFNLDGKVDGGDFLTWQRGHGLALGHAYGDADENGLVNGDDLAIWASLLGTVAANPSYANFQQDGVVNGADYLAWEGEYDGGDFDLRVRNSQFGTGVAETPTAKMPEPQTGALALAALLAGLVRRSRKSN